jgi:hypothetical protein
MALCVGAVLGPIAGFVIVPFAILGAACALMSLVLACVQVQDALPPATATTDEIDEVT